MAKIAGFLVTKNAVFQMAIDTDFMGYGTYLSFTRGENIQLIAVRVAFKSIKYL